MSTRWTHYTGDDIVHGITILEDGVGLVLALSDVIKVKVIGTGWTSTTVTVDTAHASSDLPNGKIVAEFAKAETATWQAGQVTWEVERTPDGGLTSTYQYTNAVIIGGNI